MAIPVDPKLFDTACDVVIRFKGHRSYGGEKGALKALRRRAPGRSTEAYRSVFDVLCAIYARAEAAIPRHRLERPETTSNFVEFEDIDYAACLREMDEIEPGAAMAEKRWILNWCIFWYYLK
jgi:hypothetical protein